MYKDREASNIMTRAQYTLHVQSGDPPCPVFCHTFSTASTPLSLLRVAVVELLIPLHVLVILFIRILRKNGVV